MKKLIFALPFVLAGCGGGLADKAKELHSQGIEAVGKGFGEMVIVECARSEENRRKSLAAINDYLEAKGRVERGTAFDCNGDGSPDF